MSQRSLLASLVALCARRAVLVLLIAAALAVASGWLAATRLAVTTDLGGLFNPSLPWKQRETELNQLFPQRDNLLVVVIDADTPEAADATAAGLMQVLSADTAHFTSVRRPDASPFFDRNGLLFLDKAALGTLLDQTIDAQPFLGQLVADPSARGLFAALSLVAIGVEQGANLGPFETALRGFHDTLAGAVRGE
ncbi:MAG: RND transporter, partial [Gemmatimonadaceae bacterium]|nr:RND transporter [Acetobacteraceae bacterium]